MALVARRTPPWLLAAGLALLWLAIAPRTPDLAAQVYRASLWAHEGFAVWDGAWYGGHHLPAYSLVYPPLAALVGARVVGVGSAVVSAYLFDRLATRHFGERARAGTVWFAIASIADLCIGRLTFSLGVAIGLAALLAWQRGRPAQAIVLGAVCGAASPVAGAFLALAAAAVAIHAQPPTRRVGVAISAIALGVVGSLALAFPEGGEEPFHWWSMLDVVACSVVVAAFAPKQERTLRTGALAYAAVTIAMYFLHTPMGSNVVRLGASFAGPLLACVVAGATLSPRRRALMLTAAVAIVAWQWYAPVREVSKSVGDLSMQSSYYSGLRTELAALQRRDGPARVEVPFTRSHWEAVQLANSVALARGWETQLDRKYDPLFFDNHLSPAAYARWLRRNAVRWVAVPDAALDPSGRAEALLVNRGTSFLQLRWADAHWRLYEVARPRPLVSGPGTLVSLQRDGFVVRAAHAGTLLVRVHHTRYFVTSGVAACVAATPSGWTTVRVAGPGVVRVRARLSARGVLTGSSRCTATRT